MMTTDQQQFQWICHPSAAEFLHGLLEDAKQHNPFLEGLERDLHERTSTRLFDWVDHFFMSQDSNAASVLEEHGFTPYETTPNYTAYSHEGAQLPFVVLQKGNTERGVAVKVDSIADFLMVRGLDKKIEGDYLAPLRICTVNVDHGVTVRAVERRGTRTMGLSPTAPDYLSKYMQGKELWATRPRNHEADEDHLIDATLRLAKELADLVGPNLAAHIALEVERDYWQSRNTAGQIQKNRQDRLGMGWANHDHHTFRSSRKHFNKLVKIMQTLGFHCRERFYAGQEAGWGAQVVENTEAGFVCFLDVDLEPEEIAMDFSEVQLPEVGELGTIGLWCALHGDSVLHAGMHHLEAQFLFEQLTSDLAETGIPMMTPFSDFPYLKQAFTAGEVWKVPASRVQVLMDAKKISQEQASKFLTEGAIGSHLENLQREEGFKGFNQKNVSFIIKKTDPRTIERESLQAGA